MRVLFFGDVVGKPGRVGLATALPRLRERLSPDLVIANGENTAGGVGITERTATELLDLGVDVITSGNHVYRHRDVYDYLDRAERVIRPANYPLANPGKGHTVVEAAGTRLAVLNLSGAVTLDVAQSPFAAADALLDRLSDEADAFLVDFHAEVTSEKIAMGWYLDGRVAAVVGTHTHVPTADARVLPGGTAFITDVGMTGSRNGVLGARRDQVLERFITQMPVRFEGAEGDVWINAVVVDVGPDGLATAIEPVVEPVE
ncbi:MAG: 2,3-cyclic-nucleotide 2-phosphodiesterase [Solirubrobacterales bacterium]|nr:2,3-cyclic-nucleotide 2-phosphodiesterase [Solirubrobacterales bacterium]